MFSHINSTRKKWGAPLLARVYFQKILFRLGLSRSFDFINEDDNYSNLLSRGFSIIEHQSKKYLVKLADNRKVFLRRFSSDYEVFSQVILNDEYAALFEAVKERDFAVKNIIDAGANIGLASLVFQREFPEARIYCIEPDAGNYEILSLNLKQNNINAAIIKKGLWSKNTRLYFDRNFRDGKEWAVSVSESPISEDFVDSVTIQEIIKQNEFKNIDILKLDVEGAEFEIFCGENADLSFLENTKVIALEIHEEFGDKNKILDILKNYNFALTESGEYTVAIKQ
jgi:FkbM family methyltransferase